MIPPCKNQNVVTILTILCFVLDGICSVLRLGRNLWCHPLADHFLRKTIRRSALLDRLGQSANMRMSARAQKLGLFLSVDVDDIQTVRTNQKPCESYIKCKTLTCALRILCYCHLCICVHFRRAVGSQAKRCFDQLPIADPISQQAFLECTHREAKCESISSVQNLDVQKIYDNWRR